jgi:hypothetical protein
MNADEMRRHLEDDKTHSIEIKQQCMSPGIAFFNDRQTGLGVVDLLSVRPTR